MTRRRSRTRKCFQFIGFPSEWGGIQSDQHQKFVICFQFIGFPSEWGVNREASELREQIVSNLLGSPASGETLPSR